MPWVNDPERTVEAQVFDGVVNALRKINVNRGDSITVVAVDEIPKGPFNPARFPAIGVYPTNEGKQRQASYGLEEMETRIGCEGWLQSKDPSPRGLRIALQRFKSDIYKAIVTDPELNDPSTGPASKAIYRGCTYFLSDAEDFEGGVIVEFSISYRHPIGQPYGFIG